MKNTILFLLLTTSFFACKKEEKKEGEKPPVNYVRFTHDGTSTEFNSQNSHSSWSNNNHSWSFDYKQNLLNGSTFYLSPGLKAETYTFLKGSSNPVTLTYRNNSGITYIFRQGSFKLTVCDSANYHYEGNFEGRFYNQNLDDSFDATDGSFYFKRP